MTTDTNDATGRDDHTDAADTDAAELAAFGLFDASVLRTRTLGHSLVRVTFGGESLREFASGGRDQSFSLFLPHPGQPAPLLPQVPADEWFTAYREMDPSVRAVMRSYTVAEQRREVAEVDVDFVLHGDGGPASRWAARARAGDRVALLGPRIEDNKSVGFRPPPDTDWVLLAADATALPAAAGILAWLPEGTRVRAWIEVPHEDDRIELPTAADADVVWLVRAPGTRPGLLVDAVRAADLPEGRPYAWLAGESGAVRALRRELVGERGHDRGRVEFTGYWRPGASEEDLRAEAVEG